VIAIPKALTESTLRVVALMRIIMRATDADTWPPRPLLQESAFQERAFLVAEDNGWIVWKPNPDFPPFDAEAVRASAREGNADPEIGLIYVFGTFDPDEHMLRKQWHRKHRTEKGEDTSGQWEITEAGLQAAMAMIFHLDTEGSR